MAELLHNARAHGGPGKRLERVVPHGRRLRGRGPPGADAAASGALPARRGPGVGAHHLPLGRLERGDPAGPVGRHRELRVGPLHRLLHRLRRGPGAQERLRGLDRLYRGSQRHAEDRGRGESHLRAEPPAAPGAARRRHVPLVPHRLRGELHPQPRDRAGRRRGAGDPEGPLQAHPGHGAHRRPDQVPPSFGLLRAAHLEALDLHDVLYAALPGPAYGLAAADAHRAGLWPRGPASARGPSAGEAATGPAQQRARAQGTHRQRRREAGLFLGGARRQVLGAGERFGGGHLHAHADHRDQPGDHRAAARSGGHHHPGVLQARLRGPLLCRGGQSRNGHLHQVLPDQG
mmetsp:Transcript_41998/g.121773  ORF Transcript_41998/g.121773 Transcript_41998/m.121773 type:complete len:346 (+) Transcript_41998:251-1288(+)